MDDQTRLALAARNGSEEAMFGFVQATQSDVWRFCAHLGDREAADDLTQETYLRAFRALGAFRGDSSVRTWLLTIARRVVADDLAARQRRRRLPVETLPVRLHDPADVVSTYALLDDLDPDRRTAFVLTQVIGFSYADAAAISQCPIGTIRSRVARAREDLIALLGDDTGRRPVEGAAS